MRFLKAMESDLSSIVEMIADDELGMQRENFQSPLPGNISRHSLKLVEI